MAGGFSVAAVEGGSDEAQRIRTTCWEGPDGQGVKSQGK